MTAQVHALFPTPVLRVPGLVSAQEAQSLAARLGASAGMDNHRSGALAHSRLLGPGEDAGLDAVVERIGPHLQHFGELLFGERLRWLVKEIWANVLGPGGQQAVHNHANCFASGIVYLTPCDASARTVFIRSLGGGEYVFRHAHAGSDPGAFGAGKWIAPEPAPGDLLLFPSHLLHEVPPNRGGERVTLAFNAIPHRLDAWGYAVSFQP